MEHSKAHRIANNPKYIKLVQTRSRFSWTLTAIMMLAYYGYIYLVAFNKEFLARPIGDSVITVSIPLGIGLIIFTILITGLYVRRANSEFDRLNDEIVTESK